VAIADCSLAELERVRASVPALTTAASDPAFHWLKAARREPKTGGRGAAMPGQAGDPQRRLRWHEYPLRAEETLIGRNPTTDVTLLDENNLARARADPVRSAVGHLHDRRSPEHERHEGERQGIRSHALAPGDEDPDRPHPVPVRTQLAWVRPRSAVRKGAFPHECGLREGVMRHRAGSGCSRQSLCAVACAHSPSPAPDVRYVEYLVGPPDRLTVTILPDPAVVENVVVRPDGMITVQLIGDIPAGGRTTDQISKDIENRIARFKRGAL